MGDSVSAIAYSKLRPAGQNSFEKLVADQMSGIAGITYYLAKSGPQDGLDAKATGATRISVQCKRYGSKTKLAPATLEKDFLKSSGSDPLLDAWVLATTQELASQDKDALESLAEQKNIEFLVFDASGPTPNDLDLLLASNPTVLRNRLRLRGKQLARLNVLIRKCQKETVRLAELRKRISAARIGYAHLRSRANELIARGFEDPARSKQLFRQVVAIRSTLPTPTRRKSLMDAIDAWWSMQTFGLGNHPQPLAVCAEEGDGKTWGLASWLDERIDRSDFPPVIWINASQVASSSPLEIMTAFLQKNLGFTPAQARSRLGRWLTSDSSGRPRALLIIDGLNEAPKTERWRDVLNNFEADNGNLSLSLLLTVRTGYWTKIPTSNLVHSIGQITLGAFTDDEYFAAMKAAGLEPSAFSPEVSDLVRKPRYLGLAIKYRSAILKSGGKITRSRLIYEDIKERFAAKTHFPLTHEAFQAHLIDLAKEHKKRARKFDYAAIHNGAYLDDQANAVNELITGGIFEKDGASFVLHDDQVPHALGLLVGEEMCAAKSSTSPTEHLATWLEPDAGIELKVKVLEFALLYAAHRKPPGSSGVLLAILLAWMQHQNRLSSDSDNLYAYFGVTPDTYIALAEHLANSSALEVHAEESLVDALVLGLRADKHRHLVTRTLKRWCTYLCPAGNPFSPDKEKEAGLKLEAKKRAGVSLVGNAVKIGRYEFAVVQQPHLLSLGQLAMLVISHADRREFVDEICQLALAEAIMEPARRAEMLSWLVLSSKHSLTVPIMKASRELADIGVPAARIASGWLLKWEGSQECSSKYLALDARYKFDRQTKSKDEEEDCSPWNPWDEATCKRCMDNPKVPARNLVQKLGMAVMNPQFALSPAAKKKMREMLDAIPAKDVWAQFGATQTDNSLEDLATVLCAVDATYYAAFIRKIYAGSRNRQGISLRQTIWRIPRYAYLFGPKEAAVLRKMTAQPDKYVNTLELREREFMESDLMLGWLPHVTPREQFDAIVNRTAGSNADLLTLERTYNAIQGLSSAELGLRETKNELQIRRAIWFLSAHANVLTGEVIRDIAEKFEGNKDDATRGFILKTLLVNAKAEARRQFLALDWKPDYGQVRNFELRCGSAAWLKWGDNRPFEFLADRIDFLRLTSLVNQRGKRAKESKQYVALIRAAWQLMLDSVRNTNIPAPTNVQIQLPGANEDQSLRGYDAEENEPISIQQYLRQLSASGPDKQFDEDRAKENAAADLYASVQTRFKQWFQSEVFPLEVELVEKYDRPLLGEWIAVAGDNSIAARQLKFHAFEFYRTLLCVLLEKGRTEAVELYVNLMASGGSRYVDADSGIPVADLELFAIKNPQKAVLGLWAQQLADAKYDRDLQTICVLASTAEANKWVVHIASQHIDSRIPVERTLGISLFAFINSDKALPKLTSLLGTATNSRERRHLELAIHWQRRHNFASQWLNRFKDAANDDEAFGALRSFMNAATRRSWTAVHQLIEERNALSERRRQYLLDVRSNIKSAIEKNEKDLKDTYLMRKVCHSLMWPWHDIPKT